MGLATRFSFWAPPDPTSARIGQAGEVFAARVRLGCGLVGCLIPLKDILAETFKEVRPSAHTRKLEYMDLVAVRECTDARFLPERYRNMPPEEVEGRINELRPFV